MIASLRKPSKSTIKGISLGIVAAIGTTNLWIIADGFLLAYYLRRPTNKYAVLMALSYVGLSFYSSNPITGYMAALRILLLVGLVADVKDKRLFLYGGIAFTTVQLSIALWQFGSVHRPHGLSINAVNMAESGLIFAQGYLGMIPALLMGISTSRSVLASLVIVTFMRRNLASVVVLAVAVVAFYSALEWWHLDRGSFDVAIKDVSQRIETVTDVKDSGFSWRWYGYGFDSYFSDWDIQRPHNVFILAWYELGIFAIIPFSILTIWIVKARAWFLFPVSVLLFVNEDLYWRPEGMYLVASMVVLWRGSLSFPAIDIRSWSDKVKLWLGNTSRNGVSK